MKYVDPHTALAEVRPWPGQFISLAFFVANRDVRPMNFVTPDPVHRVYFIEPDPKERERRVWADIDRAFAEPVTPNDEKADNNLWSRLFTVAAHHGVKRIGTDAKFLSGKR
jgi:hypothetical protein